MRLVLFLSAFLSCMAVAEISHAGEGSDSQLLREIYDADQAARSSENMAAGTAPTLQDERDRRFVVLRLLSEGGLTTANDFFHAGIVLHHTGSINFEDGHFASLGTESKLLAFFLFRRSHQLGHDSGRNMMAAAYNYYLHACGEDGSKFGYDFIERKPVWRPGVTEEESEALKCGFDPRPYFE